MDTSEVGITAAQLMDELAERLEDSEGASLEHVTLVAVVAVPDHEDQELDMHVYLQSSAESRLEQIGALTTATQMAIDEGSEPR